MTLKMPEREPSDGAVTVTKVTEDLLSVSVTNNNIEQTLLMSQYNAWRLFGMMSLMLGIPLSKAAGKAIKL